MSSIDNVYLSCLKWIIHPPFIPGQTMEAKFHHKAPIVAQWHVALNFENPRFGEWDLTLSVIFDKRSYEPVEIVVNNLFTHISWGEKSILNKNVPIYRFNEENDYKYCLETRDLMFQIKPCQMVVEIRMSLEEDSKIPSLPSHKDLTRLVRDLSNLSIVPHYHNVDLHADGRIVYGAHSYILCVRWSNLFEWPLIHTAGKTEIKTNISSYLLRHILIYMYSGLFIRNFPHWDKPEYFAELFQVIEKYDIRHLRDNLTKSDSSQLRESRKCGITLWYVLRLCFVNNRPVNASSLSLQPHEYSTTLGNQYYQSEFKFEIQVRKVSRVGAWLSYSLRSKVNCRIHAEVNLEVVKMIGDEAYKRKFVEPTLAHGKNYSIGPEEYIESGPVLFLGCLETFPNLTSTHYRGKTEQWFRFKICLTDGTSIDEFRSFNSSVPSVLGKYNILIDHMSQLMSERTHSDMCLKSRCSSGNNAPKTCFVHRAIVGTRIPLLHNVLVDFQKGQNLSEIETVDLSADALPYVVEYIYTGKFVDVPQRLLEEISDFANRGNLKSLSDLINDIRNNY